MANSETSCSTCTCPNESCSALTALKLQWYGITRVRPLQGGLHDWRDLGFPFHSEFGVPSRVTGERTCKTCPGPVPSQSKGKQLGTPQEVSREGQR